MYEPSQLRRFTVAEYHRLIESGILTPNDEVELWEGYLVQQPGTSPRQRAVMDLLDGTLPAQLPEGWVLRSRGAVTLAGVQPESEPEPDHAIVRRSRNRYRGEHPGPADIGGVVEVSDQLLTVDRIDLMRIYARAGIPAYWVVNLPDQVIEVYTQPTRAIDAPHYAKREVYPVGTAVPVVLDGNQVGTIVVADVMA